MKASVALTFFVIIIATLLLSHHSDDLPRLSTFTQSHDGSLNNIKNSTLGFEKIYVINLKNRTDHRDAAVLAASFTGLQLTFVEAETDVSAKALPPGDMYDKLRAPERGNWRSHMKVAALMVEEGIQSALVLEDDADWDIRIKSQMQDFAKAARVMLQPLKGSQDHADPSYPVPADQSMKHTNLRHEDFKVEEPTTSPYGDLSNWDLLWVGHCGCRFPAASDGNMPIGRVVLSNDSTVPETQHLDMQFGNHELLLQYPPFTRVVSRARVNTCTLGYALSQRGAASLLYELGVSKLDGTTDMALRSFCDGSGRPVHTCLTVQPQLFQHHRSVGPVSHGSDISEHNDGYIRQAYTKNVRWSARLNIPVLLNGSTDYIDLFKDGEKQRMLEAY
ncbi:hypothetical protein AMS68_005841 [Peltaster fructicola]|uniref:Glycosyl transferase family 25 domain-containing protein n=1 Tax=Peltaster fructicola TaxID=286661 RepID=A0A6H0Y001_9PEZI|nr:hypothetical protein AMS68_005841 [Peltaster fructicola]